jgi:hypothetical protein
MKELRWRKKGDEKWTPMMVPLEGEGNNEMVLLEGRGGHPSVCASCGKGLGYRLYVLYGPVPRRLDTDQRYCVEHSPVPVDILVI